MSFKLTQTYPRMILHMVFKNIYDDFGRILDVRFLFKFGDQNVIDSFINDSRFLRWQTSDLMRQLEKENELCE